MDAKFIVFDECGQPAQFSQLGVAQAHAAELAAAITGTSFAVYERSIAYRGRVVVEDDAPKAAPAKEAARVP